ncbi:hypothetical protein AB1N83_013561, partial [Pleurotus pulmonarius]
TGYIC